MMTSSRYLSGCLAGFGFLVLAAISPAIINDGLQQYVQDASITARLKTALIRDDQIKAIEVEVDTNQGVVQLSGFVDSPDSESRAVQLAEHTNGVRLVRDDIIVIPNARQDEED